jgi:hypothetical protein
MICAANLPFLLPPVSLAHVTDVQDVMCIIFLILLTFMTIATTPQILGGLRGACTVWRDSDNAARTFFSKALGSHSLDLGVR